MNHAYDLRIKIVFLLLLLYYGAITLRLYIVQVQYNHFFSQKSELQYKKSHVFFPPRGHILDRHGKPLALNNIQASAFIEPHTLQQPKELKPFLKSYFPHVLEKLHTPTAQHFMFIKRRLSPAQELLIKASGLKDIHILQEPSRFYPNETIMHLVGLTDIDNKGLFGIEKIYQEKLAGTPTMSTLEKDARSGNYYFNKITDKKGIEGQPITLTIDSHIQHIAHTRLQEAITQWKAQEGMVMVVNPDNGEILAIAQHPFCPATKIQHATLEHGNNMVCTKSYELGSVVKVFSALAALDEGVVQADEPVDCLNIKKGEIHGFEISTWKEHGILPFTDVIAFSNNFGIASVAQRLGKKLYNHYQRLGFGKKTSLNWPGEQHGFINPPHKWSARSFISLSFGYEISMTIAQLAQAFCIIACNGIKKDISLIKNEKQSETRIYNEKTIAIIRDILEKTVQSGTGKHAALSKSSITKDYKILGKTGTANMVIDGVYNTMHNTYVFAGIVEKKASPHESEKSVYKRVVITFMKEIQNNTKIYASSVTAPLFQKIIEDMILYEKQF